MEGDWHQLIACHLWQLEKLQADNKGHNMFNNHRFCELCGGMKRRSINFHYPTEID